MSIATEFAKKMLLETAELTDKGWVQRKKLVASVTPLKKEAPNPILEAALKYQKMGLSVIPCILTPCKDRKTDKKPLVAWAEFQTRKATRDEIESWFIKWPDASIGIVTGAISGLVVIDVDDLQVGTAALEPLLPDTLPIPTAMTPRGGQHLYFKNPSQQLTNDVKQIVQGCDLRAEGGFVVVPPSPGYEWMIDSGIEDLPLPELPIKYLERAKEVQGGDNGTPKNPEGWKDELLGGVERGHRDESLTKLMGAWIKSGNSKKECMILAQEYIKNCTPPFEERNPGEIYRSILERHERNHPTNTAQPIILDRTKNATLLHETNEWIGEALPGTVFGLEEIFRAVKPETKEQQRVIRQFLHRNLIPNGVIEQAGEKSGCFRKIDESEETLDISEIAPTPLKIILPCESHLRLKLFNGNIIVVAGEKDSGKTAYCLNTAYENFCIPTFSEIRYITNEMEETELSERIHRFDLKKYPLEEWRKIKHLRSRGDIKDLVRPGALNICDYVSDPNGDYYKMSAIIRRIGDKLQGKGVAIVCLQKNTNAPWGEGGEKTLQLARIGINLERLWIPEKGRPEGRLYLTKAKNWKDGANDGTNARMFDLIAGSVFRFGEWFRYEPPRVEAEK